MTTVQMQIHKRLGKVGVRAAVVDDGADTASSALREVKAVSNNGSDVVSREARGGLSKASIVLGSRLI